MLETFLFNPFLISHQTLKKLKNAQALFRADLHAETTPAFTQELTNLRDRDLIADQRQTGGLDKLLARSRQIAYQKTQQEFRERKDILPISLDSNGATVDVKEYVYLTAEGENYLALLDHLEATHDLLQKA